MVKQIRQSWPRVTIILRADAGFGEANQVEYVFGFAHHERLRRIIDPHMQQAAALHRDSGQAARVFTEFAYKTNTSWSRPRPVVAKAEQIEGKENPRYVVTSLDAADWPAQKLYEQLYCARGDMENRIKEQYSLFAGRVSTATVRANQLRLYLSAAAYVLMSAFRRLALSGTAWARAQCETIRSQLLRIRAQVRITTRKVWISIASSYPHWRVFAHTISTCAAEANRQYSSLTILRSQRQFAGGALPENVIAPPFGSIFESNLLCFDAAGPTSAQTVTGEISGLVRRLVNYAGRLSQISGISVSAINELSKE